MKFKNSVYVFIYFKAETSKTENMTETETIKDSRASYQSGFYLYDDDTEDTDLNKTITSSNTQEVESQEYEEDFEDDDYLTNSEEVDAQEQENDGSASGGDTAVAHDDDDYWEDELTNNETPNSSSSQEEFF